MNSRSWFQELVPFRRSSSSKRHRQRRNLLRTLRRECLESRTLMAADVYVAKPTTTPSLTSSYYVDSNGGSLTAGDLVDWYSYQGGPSQSGLTYGTDAFGTISEAISAAVAGDTVIVGAGTFAESTPGPLTINKSLTLEGPNVGIAGNGTRPHPEAVIVPPTVGSVPNGGAEIADGKWLISITAPNVTIDGVVIDGDNPGYNGQDYRSLGADLEVDVGVHSDATGTVVTNSIVRNILQFGVALKGNDGDPLFGEVTKNKLNNIPWYSGIIAFNDYYANISDNAITNVWTAIQTNNHWKPSPSLPAITNNTITANSVTITGQGTGLGYNGIYSDVGGIFHNLQYANASAWNISNNTMTNTPVSAGSIGITVWSVSIPTTLSGNSVTGFEEGYDFWNVSGPITVSGGSVTGSTTGVVMTNYLDSYGSGGTTNSVTLSGVAIANSSTGVQVIDDPLNGNNATVSMTLTGGSSITGGVTGLKVQGKDASVPSVGNTVFSGQTGNYIELSNQGNTGVVLDATGATFDGKPTVAPSPTTLSEYFAIENKIFHKVDNSSLGFVRVESGNVFITPQSGPPANVQNAVDAAVAGDTVWIEAGSYVTGSATTSVDNLTVNVPAGVTGFTGLVLGSTVTNGTATLTGAGAANLTGNSSNNTLNGNDGDNVITGGLGSDIINGGGGYNTAAYSGKSSQYTWTNVNGVFTVYGPEGTDTLTNINTLLFSDGPVVILGGAVTGTSLKTFDTNSSVAGRQFNLLFTPNFAIASGNYRLTDSNPGQFYYNLLYQGAPNTTADITINVPYAFVPRGNVPIRVYDSVTSQACGGESCFKANSASEIKNYVIAAPSGASLPVSTGQATWSLNPNSNPAIGSPYQLFIPNVPTSADGFVYINVNLDYSLEKQSGWNRAANDDAIGNSTNTPARPNILENTAHQFFATSTETILYSTTATVYNDNNFKNIKGVGAMFQADQTATSILDHDPVAGQRIVIIDSATQAVQGNALTDVDGWYWADFNASGSATSYTAVWDQNNNGNWQEDLAVAGRTRTFLLGGTAKKFAFVDYTVRDPVIATGSTLVTSYLEMISTLPDDVAPFVSSTEPLDETTNVPQWANITLNFSEPVKAGVGNFEIYSSSGALWSAVSVTDTSQVTYVGSVVTINPSSDLPVGQYYLRLPYGAVKDTVGNDFAGMLDKRTLNFTVVTPLVQVQSISSSATTEGNGKVTFAVSLLRQPNASVTVPLSSSNTAEGTVSPASLTFTTTNWNQTQTVTVTGVNDNLDDGDMAYRVLLGAMSSTDSVFKGVDPADVSLLNVDNDTAGITVTQNSTTTSENRTTATFTVKLNSQPINNVTIPISSSNTAEGTVSTSLLTFTSANWSTAQTVTVTGVDDFKVDGNIAYSVIIGAATSIDDPFYGIDPADLNFTNSDNDTAGIIVSAPSGPSTTEAGGAVTFTVRLNSQPLNNASVTVPMSSSNTAEGTVSPSSLTFTSSNWSTPQTVTVTGKDDTVLDGNVAYTITVGKASSADAMYNNLPLAYVNLTNLDNEVATKFYVVDDATTDRTYRYGATGQALGNFAINSSGNTAPRGITATAAGDKLWVVDANRTVYVYSNSGVLLGSWSTGLSTSTIEGITTDGTNIWLVDSALDRIHYFAGAATRTSGSQTAVSFALATASGNLNAKDLVYGMNGTTPFIWVVDDATTDKVFRYTVNPTTGGVTLSNAWNLNSKNTLPTGIALNPGSTLADDLWVLNNGSTKQVYRYVNGRGVSNTTSPTSSVLFAMSGLTNAQGFADPPPVAPVDRVFSDLGESVATASRNATAAPRSDAWSAAGALVGGNSQNGLAVDRRGSSLAGIPAAVDYRVASAVAKNSTAVRGAALVTDSTLPLNVKKTSQPQSLSAESVDRLFEEFPGTRKRS